MPVAQRSSTPYVGFMKTAAILVGVFALLALVAWYAGHLVSGVGGFQMPLSVWIAMILGVIATLALGAALMALVFYSSRQGYDEPPQVEQDPEPRRD